MSKRKSIILVIFITVLILMALIILPLKNTINKEDVAFIIEPGSPLNKISRNLEDENIVKSKNVFSLYAKIKGFENKIQAGEYRIPPKVTMDDLLNIFQDPKQKYKVITIPEGFNIYQIAEKLEKEGVANKDKFLSLTLEDIGNDYIDKSNRNMINPLEGYFFPDTYYLLPSYSEEEIAKIMFNRFNEVLDKALLKYELKRDLTINELITIASLIEKEAANNKERNKIAGVIYNRLNKEMLLQIDASVIYGITEGKGHINRVTYEDLKTPSPYNSYLNKGLPPNPIASPGKASIEAALNPEKHAYLYYVLGESGHVFSRTYKEHLENVKNYREQYNN